MTERATRQWAPPALLSLLVAASALVAEATPSAPPVEKSRAAVKAEIDFARGLATEWSFVDLAESVLRKAETDGVPREMSDRFEIVKCEVIAAGAKSARDQDRKLELYERALDAYGRFLEENSYSSEKASANAGFVQTASDYSSALTTALEEALGERGAELRSRKQDVLERALGRANEEINSLTTIPLSERTSSDKVRLFNLYLNKGRMLSDLAELFIASGSEGSTFFGDAIAALEELVFEAGMGTAPAMQAYTAIGEVYLKQGDSSTAADYLTAVIDQTIPVDRAVWQEAIKEQELTDADKQLRFKYMQRTIDPLMQAFLAMDNQKGVTQYALHFYNTQRREGFTFDGYGYLGMLAVAEALLEVGGYVGGNLTQGEGEWFATIEDMEAAGFKSSREQTDTTELALRIAQNVSEENPANILRLKSQAVISEIITRPGVVVSPQVLFEAAQGQYHDDEFHRALEGYHRVLRALEVEGQATRIEFGARVMNGIGNCYRKLDMPILAAMAYREGCTTWLGDIAYDGLNANGYYKMIEAVEKQAAIEKDKVTALLSEAQRIVAEESETSRDQVLYNIGKQKQKKRDWKGAISEYEKIEDSSDWWEKGVVDIAVCRFRDGDTAGALRGFDEYLEGFLKDEKRSKTESPLRLAKRREASATAEFYRGFITFSQAESKKDDALYRKTVELLSGFEDRYPEQPQLAAWTMNMVVQSHLVLDQISEARDVMTKLAKTYPDESRTGQASLVFYNELLSKQRAATDPERKTSLLREMAQHLERGNAVGDPKFRNLQNEAKHWYDLGEWQKVATVSARLIGNFDGDAEYLDDMSAFTKPRYGKALLHLGRVAEAKEVLTPLVMDESKPAPKSTMLAWAESIIGIVDASSDPVQILPGAGGDDEEFELLTSKLNSYANAGDKWTSCEWYALKFQLIYAYYVWGQKNDRKLDSAKSQLATIETETGTTFEPIGQFCSPEKEADEDVVAEYGGGKLRRAFRWLQRTLN